VAQQPIEMILLQLWASYIAIPVWLVDIDGNLVYYNEPAEQLLGKRFDEVGEINAIDLADVFVTTDFDGVLIPAKEGPLVIALEERLPAYRSLRFRDFGGAWHDIEVTALPIEGQGGRLLGAFAAFWEIER
jgi:PAS domain-containing protein